MLRTQRRPDGRTDRRTEDRRTDKPKPIFPLNFEVGGIKRKGKQNTDLTVCPCIIYVFLIYHFTHYTTAGCIRIISCSMLTGNDEFNWVYCGEARTLVLLRCYPFCNGIGDLLTRPARNFIYTQFSYIWFVNYI